MRLPQWLVVTLGWAALAGACTSDLELGIAGKRCDPNRQCLAGYRCDIQNICVREGLSVHDDAGVGSGSDAGGDGGAGQGMSGGPGSFGGRGGRAGSGGSTSGGGLGGVSGSSGSGGAGAAGTPNEPDGGSGTLPDGGCLATTVYFDGDGDGFGDDAESAIACPSLDWVTVGGDCRDDQASVKPGQTQHFAVGYPSSGPGGISFDYDCVNGEQPDPNNDTNAPAPDCAALLGLGLGCSGSGFEDASPARSGPGVEPRCGSNIRRDCVGDGLTTCDPEQTPVADSVAFRCK